MDASANQWHCFNQLPRWVQLFKCHMRKKKIHYHFQKCTSKHALTWSKQTLIVDVLIPQTQVRANSINVITLDGEKGQLKLSSHNVTNDSNAPQLPKGLCLEKLGNNTYVQMVPHPDGSNRVFVCNQRENGRFFVLFNCDKFQQPGCEGRCSCNTDVSCDPSKIESLQDTYPCQFHVAIAEFTANRTTSSSKLSWKGHANSVEVRRIFTMGLPFEAYHACQILFGPADGYLYIMMGDGSHDADAYNFAQNKKSLLGKILRLDVDIIPSAEEIHRLGLWGNYSIPKDNPYTTDKELEPEIWALGLRNPWRCSFDSEEPSRFICGECGKDRYEEIDVIKKGGNYGWGVYEGPYPTSPSYALSNYTQPNSITPIFPVAGYSHDDVDASKGPASVVGGYFYRAVTDPCLYGWYIYTDLYIYAIWAAIETLENSKNFTTFSVPFGCSHDSPMQCGFKPVGHNVPELGYVLSMSEDNNKDLFLLTSTGVYRVSAPSRCGYRCSKERFSNPTRVCSSGSLWKATNLVVCFVSFMTLVLL